MIKVISIFLVFSINLHSQEKLPFVGKRFFNFVGGTGEQEMIIIKKDGTTIIQSATGNELNGVPVIWYKGKYKSIMTSKFTNYHIVGNYIYSVDKNGKKKKGCKNDNELCQAELYKP